MGKRKRLYPIYNSPAITVLQTIVTLFAAIGES